MSNNTDFEPFPKLQRLNAGMVITEKVDGTNAQILIKVDGCHPTDEFCHHVFKDDVIYHIRAGSRKRWVKPGDDNFGFGAWVWEHAEELINVLGTGRHFGEWYGKGIQRGYNKEDKRLALFNVLRWHEQNPVPDWLDVVPTLYKGDFDMGKLAKIFNWLKDTGSVIAPGFDNPEGIVVYLPSSKTSFKVTYDYDGGKFLPKDKHGNVIS